MCAPRSLQAPFPRPVLGGGARWPGVQDRPDAPPRPTAPRRYLGIAAAAGGSPAPAPRGPPAAPPGPRPKRPSTERLREKTRLENTPRAVSIQAPLNTQTQARPARCAPENRPRDLRPAAAGGTRSGGGSRARPADGPGRAAACAGGNRRPSPARLAASAATTTRCPRSAPSHSCPTWEGPWGLAGAGRPGGSRSAPALSSPQLVSCLFANIRLLPRFLLRFWKP